MQGEFRGNSGFRHRPLVAQKPGVFKQDCQGCADSGQLQMDGQALFRPLACHSHGTGPGIGANCNKLPQAPGCFYLNSYLCIIYKGWSRI